MFGFVGPLVSMAATQLSSALWHKDSHRWYINEWAWPWASFILLVDTQV